LGSLLIGCGARTGQWNESNARAATRGARQEGLDDKRCELVLGEWIDADVKGREAKIDRVGVDAVTPIPEIYVGVGFVRVRSRHATVYARGAITEPEHHNAGAHRSSHDVLDVLSVLIISVAPRFWAHNPAIAIPQWAKP
jgi:hypothetical protein